MPAPFHITGVPVLDWIIFGGGAAVCVYWLRALRLARQGARFALRNLARAAIVFCVLIVALTAVSAKSHLLHQQEQVLAGFFAFCLFLRFQKTIKRSRSIPKATRKAVIARDLKGEKFDPEKHHVDHVWPFSRGGSHTVDNLRVIEKKRNLRKGAKRPGMREMW